MCPTRENVQELAAAPESGPSNTAQVREKPDRRQRVQRNGKVTRGMASASASAKGSTKTKKRERTRPHLL